MKASFSFYMVNNGTWILCLVILSHCWCSQQSEILDLEMLSPITTQHDMYTSFKSLTMRNSNWEDITLECRISYRKFFLLGGSGKYFGTPLRDAYRGAPWDPPPILTKVSPLPDFPFPLMFFLFNPSITPSIGINFPPWTKILYAILASLNYDPSQTLLVSVKCSLF